MIGVKSMMMLDRWKSFLEHLNKSNQINDYNLRCAIEYWNYIQYEYSLENGRFYHNLDHINHCLSEFDDAIENGVTIADRDLLELAIWFHDIIYKPYRDQKYEFVTNEMASGECVLNFIHTFKLPIRYKVVYDYIKFTEYTAHPQDYDIKVLMDIDLSGLGSPEAVFNNNGRNLRKEYDHLGDSEYNELRKQQLNSFLSGKIYKTDYFREKYETQARKNIERTLIGEKV